MASATKIFISASSADLRTFRNQVKVWLLDMGWLPVVQEHFAPDDETVIEMLTKRISECDAVVHIIGQSYGAEPKTPLKGESRKSFTQLEAVIARKLKKRLFTVLLDEDFPYDEHKQEAPDLRLLQQAYRLQVATGEHLYIPCRHPDDLEPEIRKLRVEIDKLNKSRRRLAVLATLPLLIILPLAAYFWYSQHAMQSELDVTVARLTKVEDKVQGASTAAAEDQALAEERAILKPVIPDIETIPREALRGFVTELVGDLQRPAANPDDYSGAVKRALADAQVQIGRLKVPDAAKLLDDALARTDTGSTEGGARGRAALLAERGRVARLQLRYREAAGFYQKAADAMASDPKMAREYLLGAAASLFVQGKNLGDNAALADAIKTYEAALAQASREQEPAAWAAIQDSLGTALEEMGERDSGTERLEAAIAAYSEALKVRTREAAPKEWAATKNNLGAALVNLGDRQDGTEQLEAAVEAYTDALGVRTQDDAPLEWATTENNLGNAQLRLGERADDTTDLQAAAEAYSQALKVRTHEQAPLEWAATMNNLGYVHRLLGERETGHAQLEEAIDDYEKALSVRTRDRVPLAWAMTQDNLGLALDRLGERETGTKRLEQAVAAFTAALEEYTRERVPRDWAETQNNLGLTLQALGERETGATRLEAAVAAYSEALKEYTRETDPLDWAQTQNNLGYALKTLGDRETGTARLEAAVAAYTGALQEYTRDKAPLDWAMTQDNLGNALKALAERENGTDQLDAAITAYNQALKVRTHDRVPLDWAMTTGDQGLALLLLAKRKGDADMAKAAVEQIEVAYTTAQGGGDTSNADYYKAHLPEARAILSQLNKH